MKMKKLAICLACNLGSSTSILVNKMRQVAASSQKLATMEVKIDAIPAGNITASEVQDYQIIMLGPQIGHRRQEIAEKVAAANIPVVVINFVDYGSMNAAHILKEAILEIKKQN